MVSRLQTQKDILRGQARARRAALTPGERLDAAHRIAHHFLQALDLPRQTVVAGYCPMDGEADVLPLLSTLAGDRGCRTCLPVVADKGQPLVFRQWVPGDMLARGRHGTRHPVEDAQALVPQVVLVPLLAYDARGWRLGFGAGYYDRTLQALRACNEISAVGVGYSSQELPEIPHDEETDQRLDWIVTEKGVISSS